MNHHTPRSPELEAVLQRLFALETFGVKLGLEPVSALLEEMGNPQRSFPAIHVAGTNGKGSVCSLLAGVLQSAGLRVGLYTSPHLVEFGERMRVNGLPIPDDRLADYAEELLPAIERHGCTFFEGTTAMAFRYFADEQVDVAVIETGLGGRLDATNVLQPLLSVVTGIALDHTRHLGSTLEEIAGEKAGIIKPDAPAVIGPLGVSSLRSVFERAAAERGTRTINTDEVCRAALRALTLEGTVGTFMCEGWGEIAGLRIGLVGRHQIANARTALAALAALRNRFALREEHLRAGFGDVRRLTGLRGRMELVPGAPQLLLDVAHNPDGVRALADTLGAVGIGRVQVVLGAVEEKDLDGMLALLEPHIATLHAVRAATHRARLVEEIAEAARRRGIVVERAGTVADGIADAIEQCEPDGTVIVCGSFYVVGEAVEMIEEERRGGKQTVQIHVEEDGLPTYDSRRRPPVKEWSRHSQPRERLRDHGPGVLSDAELLAILLRTGTPERNVLEVAGDLLLRYGPLSDLLLRSVPELTLLHGVGEAKAITIAAALELARRVQSREFGELPLVRSPEDVARIFIPKLRGVMKEQFHVVLLNTAGRMMRSALISEGSLGSAVVHPREVFHPAVVERAAAVIGLHNHPSGNPQASREDIAITHQLVEAGRALGIPFNDHLIIAGERWVSLAALGHIS